MTETDWAYLAGIVDGEGCIGVYESRRSHSARGILHICQLSIANTDYQLMDIFSQHFGGWITTRPCPPGKDMYYWQVSSERAEPIIRNLLPYLRIKKEQAYVAIRFCRTLQHNNKRLSDKTFKERQRCRQLMQQLNYRGIHENVL